MKKMLKFIYHIMFFVLYVNLICITYNYYDVWLEKESMETMLVFLFCIAILIFGTAYIMASLACLLESFGEKLGVFARKLSFSDRSDFKFSSEYYRDILEKTSPLVLGYIDNFEVDKNKLIAEILYLKDKGMLEIKNGKLSKNIVENLEENVSNLDKLIMNSIENGRIGLSNWEDALLELSAYTIEQSEKLFLIEEKHKYKKSRTIKKSVRDTFNLCCRVILVLSMLLLCAFNVEIIENIMLFLSIRFFNSWIYNNGSCEG